jgi:TP901 family phage tail tape measure protein
MNIGDLTASLGCDVSGLSAATSAMKNFERSSQRSMQTVQESLNNAGTKMQSFGQSASMYLTAPIVLAGAAVMAAAGKFEIAMQHIVGLVGVSQAQVNKWSQEILSLSGKIGRPPTELAEALYFVTSSGIQGAAALDVVTQSAKGASAGLGETMQIADLVTSAMNAYRNSGLTAATALDVLTAAVREGKGEASQYASQMGEVIPVAAKMGVSFDQVAAAMSAMTLTGTNVSESATYMRQILMSLLDPTKQSAEALVYMGTSAGELRKMIREQGLLAALTKLNDLTNRYGEDAMAKVFPNVRALTGVLSLMGDRLEENRGIFDRVNKSSGDMNKAFQSVTETIDFKYNQATAKMKASFIQIGMSLKTTVIPLIEGLGDAIQSLALWYTNLSASTRQIITYTAGFLAVLGPVSLAIGVTMKMMSGLIGAASGVLTIFKGLSAIIAANPYLLIAAGIIAATVALVNYNSKSDEFKKIQTEVNAQLGDELFKLNDVFERLKQTNVGTSERSELIKIINTRYGEYLSNLLTEKSTLLEIEQAQRQATNALVASISLKTYRAKLEQEMTSISKSFESTFKDFTQGFSTTFGGDRIGEFITGIFQGADEAIKNGNPLQVSQELYDKFVEKMSKSTGYLKYSIEDFRAAFTDFVKVKGEKNEVVSQINAMINAYEKLTSTKKQEETTGAKAGGGKDTVFGEKIKYSKLVLEQYKAHLDKMNEDLKQNSPIETLQAQVDGLNYKKLLMYSSDVGTPLQKLQTQLADVALKNATFGDSLDPLGIKMQTFGDQISFVKSQMELLWSSGYRPGTPLMDMYIKKLGELTEAQRKANLTAKIGAEVQSLYDASIDGSIKTVGDFANALRHAIIKIIAMYVAEAIAVQVANAMKSAKNPWLGLILGAAAGAATSALFESIIPKFANGGTVPNGYPNDSYPALLSSGEKVIPPNKLGELDTNKNAMQGEVVFRISGNELIGVLEKQTRKNKVM